MEKMLLRFAKLVDLVCRAKRKVDCSRIEDAQSQYKKEPGFSGSFCLVFAFLLMFRTAPEIYPGNRLNYKAFGTIRVT
jgi:hypothetical protein